ncbi:hypothetical protein NHX12_002877 [Muraenolepis orangiensis]|uniref:AT-rich interactive domain-containing protein 3 n=1 Tax=Muraenolepis orangiensis TaxID=630683 RepID=A0A9Q0IFL0_9TELE|nr:hypothetical protein NHX12_002877 [Muraenolepis orangiensis]
MMDYSKAQMEGSSAGAGIHQGNPAGVKLEAVMEHLQRQLEAKLDHPDKHLQQAQLLFAKHAAESRAFGSIPDTVYFGKGASDGKTPRPGHQTFKLEPGDLGESFYEDGERKLDESDPAAYYSALSLATYAASSLAAKRPVASPPLALKEEPEEKLLTSPAQPHGFTSPDGFATDWSFDDSSKHQRTSAAERTEENEGGKARGEPSRDFAKLYEIDGDPNRKEFLDELFIFMQKRGTPVNRIPIMAKQVLDLYKLYKLVTEKGGLVEVINKKIWREITKGLNLPTSITSAAFTLRTQYMKYLYAFECDKKRLSSPGELQAAIDSNRREGKRSSYGNGQYHYSPSPAATPRGGVPPLSNPMHGLHAAAGIHNGHLREKLEMKGAGGAEGPEKSMARLAEEHQRLMQQAFQQNLLAMASHFSPMNHLKPSVTHESKPDLALSIGANGAAGINVSVEVNGVVYSGMLFAQKAGGAPVVSQNITPAGTSGFSALSSSHSPSSSSSSSSK